LIKQTRNFRVTYSTPEEEKIKKLRKAADGTHNQVLFLV
jgi:hypothetical protein